MESLEVSSTWPGSVNTFCASTQDFYNNYECDDPVTTYYTTGDDTVAVRCPVNASHSLDMFSQYIGQIPLAIRPPVDLDFMVVWR